MNTKKIIVIIIGLTLGTIIFLSSLEDIPVESFIKIEAENAQNIKPPFELILDPDASGGKAVTTTMRSENFESYLSYTIRIKAEGKYRFLANCYWPGGCNNSFILQFDNGNRYVFGNDKNKFDIWHWVKGPVVKLTKGKHKLKIWNKESFSKIDQIILTLNPDFEPMQ